MDLLAEYWKKLNLTQQKAKHKNKMDLVKTVKVHQNIWKQIKW